MAIFKNKLLLQELGFGSREYKASVRFIDKKGTVNVKRSGLGFFENLDVYHWLISARALHLNLTILAWYVLINLLFAVIYFMVGPQNFGGLDVSSGKDFDEFIALFFFSAQTITTLGYGHIYPIGPLASTAAAFESLLGLISFAVATGILYGRFSRPKAHLIYSKNLLIAPYKQGKAIMFRLVNMKQSELIESEVKLNVTFNNPETNKREFYSLNLEIEKVNFLPMNWTIVHALDENSPISGFTLEDFKRTDIEFLILFKAINDTVSQNVYSRYSYKEDDVIEQARFMPIVPEIDHRGRLHIKVNDIDLFQKLS